MSCYVILHQDIIFASPGGHVLLKWTKTLQESRSHHFVQTLLLGSHPLCPVSALRALFHTRPLPSQVPLFATQSSSFSSRD